MRHILLIFSIVFSSAIFAQKNTGSVLYGYKKSLSLGGPYGVDYNASLVFDSEKSIYVYAKDSLEGKHIHESLVLNNGDKYLITNKSTNEKGFIHFFDRTKNIAQHRDLGFQYIKENIPKINWTITNETKTIGKFVCIKAKGHFRGREYTAWYTMAIPVPFGPWKLQGLPGLILKAYDTHKEVYFYFKSLEYPYSKPTYIKAPDPDWDNKQWISIKEYKNDIIRAHKRALENGRLIREQLNVIESLKSTMKNSYIEVFDEEH